MSRRVGQPSAVATPAVYLTSNGTAHITPEAESARDGGSTDHLRVRAVLGPAHGVDDGVLVRSRLELAMSGMVPALFDCRVWLRDSGISKPPRRSA